MARRPHEAFEGDTAVANRQRTERPRTWRVLLHNDDFTTQDFVIDVLVRHFHKAPAEAIQIMLEVHFKGVGLAGRYPKDVAETKVAEVMREARAAEMPLLLTAEPESGRSEG